MLTVISRFILVCTFFFSCACLGAEQTFDLKGIAIGASEGEVTARFPNAVCRERQAVTVERMCVVSKDTYGGSEATLFFALIGGKVSNMSATFKPAEFNSVTSALKERFGSPTSEQTDIVTNRMGAQFENLVLTWQGNQETLVARRYAGALDRSSVLFLSDASIEEFKRRSGQEKQERAKDL